MPCTFAVGYLFAQSIALLKSVSLDSSLFEKGHWVPLTLPCSEVEDVLWISTDWSTEERIGLLALEHQLHEVVCFHRFILNIIRRNEQVAITGGLVESAVLEVGAIF